MIKTDLIWEKLTKLIKTLTPGTPPPFLFSPWCCRTDSYIHFFGYFYFFLCSHSWAQFCPFINTFSQRCHSLHCWDQLWPVVGLLWSQGEAAGSGSHCLCPSQGCPWHFCTELSPHTPPLLPKPAHLQPVHWFSCSVENTAKI